MIPSSLIYVEKTRGYGVAMEAKTTFFHKNPRLKTLTQDREQLEQVFRRGKERFGDLAVFHEGNSIEIRKTSTPGLLMERFSPTIYSYTANRAGIIDTTNLIRMAVTRIFWDQINKRGISTCALACEGDTALITQEVIPPVEVVVKGALIGTPAHVYYGLFQYTDRYGKAFVKGELHAPYIRFDYRNPLQDEAGHRLRDECLPPALAERFINTKVAEQTAMQVFKIVEQTLQDVDMRVLDMCLFLNVTGKIVCGELSPDNMRIKDLQNNQDFDKDVWRKGKSSEELLINWQEIQARLEQKYGQI